MTSSCTDSLYICQGGWKQDVPSHKWKSKVSKSMPDYAHGKWRGGKSFFKIRVGRILTSVIV